MTEQSNCGNSYNRPDHRYNDVCEDIDIEDDPFYLKYYRSFHNHELDANLVINEALVYE